jgi:hypothetical protein
MPLTLTECTDKGRWDQFVTQSPHGSVFCLTPFLDALGEEYQLLFVEENGQTVAGVPLILCDGQPYPAQYPLTMYQGVLLSARLCRQPSHRRARESMEVVDFLLAKLEERFAQVSLCLHYHFEDLRGFSWFHYHEPQRGQFRLGLRYTGILKLEQVADFDSYLRSIRKLRLREYRRAQTCGFTVVSSTDIDTLDRLHAVTLERQGIARSHQEVRLIRSVAQAAFDRGYGELLFCLNDRAVVVSATLFLYDERCSYYLIGANDPEYRQSGSGTYLMLENIRRSRLKGLECIDFVGINSPTRGDFKTSFNAIPVPYFVATWDAGTREEPV